MDLVPGRPTTVVALFAALVLSGPVGAQVAGSLVSEKGLGSADSRFRLKAEVKTNFRDSMAETFVVNAPQVQFPVVDRTVSPHSSFELSNVALIGEGDFTPDISAKLEIHFIDLYNRNPTSSDDRVFVREAWLRFGRKQESLQPIPGTTVYLAIGKFPRFTKQVVRQLESYGLWGTAVGRFEEVGLEAGGSVGKNVYWRASMTNGNPLFMRDTNALAGDNGTPERVPNSTTPSVYESGFPILYDAKANDVNFRGQFQYGGGLGLRFNWGERSRSGVDVLAWYFARTLADRVSIRGSYYSGDLGLLEGVGVSLPLSGRDKIEYGANLEARVGPFHLFGQAIRQEIAGLVRKGVEVEGALRIPLNGLFASGDTPVLNWIQPVVRISAIHNGFHSIAGFVAPSLTWDWYKYDFGVRLGIVRGVDLTAEFSRHDVILRAGVMHEDEFLSTLRLGF